MIAPISEWGGGRPGHHAGGVPQVGHPAPRGGQHGQVDSTKQFSIIYI